MAWIILAIVILVIEILIFKGAFESFDGENIEENIEDIEENIKIVGAMIFIAFSISFVGWLIYILLVPKIYKEEGTIVEKCPLYAIEENYYIRVLSNNTSINYNSTQVEVFIKDSTNLLKNTRVDLTGNDKVIEDNSQEFRWIRTEHKAKGWFWLWSIPQYRDTLYVPERSVKYLNVNQ